MEIAKCSSLMKILLAVSIKSNVDSSQTKKEGKFKVV